jgi:hypothetical protein
MSNSGADAAGAGLVIGVVLFYGAIILISIASFVFWIVELIDVCRREFPDPNSKIIWLLVVVLAHGLGALIYYFAGKPNGRLPGEYRPWAQPLPPVPPGPPPGQWPPPPGANL